MGFRFAILGAGLALSVLIPKGCGKSSGDDGGTEAATTAAPSASDTASAAPSTSAPTTTHTTPHAAAKDAGGDGAAATTTDGGASGDAGASAKGTLPPKIDAPPADNNDKGPYAHYDAATLATKVHARDPMLNACYTSTGKDPGYWAPRCYELHFGAEGNVSSVTGKSTDPLGLCIKGALLGVQLGAPKDKNAGKAGICMSTR